LNFSSVLRVLNFTQHQILTALEITLNKKGTTEGLLKIKLNEGDYQPHVEEKVKDYARKATIKGFRQGKVPTGVIKKMFGKSILVDEINHLLSHKITDYIKENNLKILGEPLPNHDKTRDIDWEGQKDFEFEYQIGMVEDFTYDLSAKAKVKGYKIELDKKVMDETIADLRKRFGKVTYPESSEIGDNIFGELRSEDGGFKRDQSFIATDKIAKKEQKKFVGLKKDDEVSFDIDSVFTDEEQKAQLLGDVADAPKGSYTLKITTISRTELSDVNQELFDRVFGKDTVTTEEDFNNKVRETIGENYKRETDHFLDHHIEDYFLDNTKINLPSDFLKSWLKATSQGQVTDSVLEKEFEQYVRSLKWDLIKTKIADDNSIKVEVEEVKDRAKELITAQFGGPAFAAQFGDRLDAFADNYLQNENGQNFTRLYNQLKHDKIMKLVKEKITVEEKGVTVDEFKKIVEEHKH
jgi:trigger factor